MLGGTLESIITKEDSAPKYSSITIADTELEENDENDLQISPRYTIFARDGVKLKHGDTKGGDILLDYVKDDELSGSRASMSLKDLLSKGANSDQFHNDIESLSNPAMIAPDYLGLLCDHEDKTAFDEDNVNQFCAKDCKSEKRKCQIDSENCKGNVTSAVDACPKPATDDTDEAAEALYSKCIEKRDYGIQYFTDKKYTEEDLKTGKSYDSQKMNTLCDNDFKCVYNERDCEDLKKAEGKKRTCGKRQNFSSCWKNDKVMLRFMITYIHKKKNGTSDVHWKILRLNTHTNKFEVDPMFTKIPNKIIIKQDPYQGITHFEEQKLNFSEEPGKPKKEVIKQIAKYSPLKLKENYNWTKCKKEKSIPPMFANCIKKTGTVKDCTQKCGLCKPDHNLFSLKKKASGDKDTYLNWCVSKQDYKSTNNGCSLFGCDPTCLHCTINIENEEKFDEFKKAVESEKTKEGFGFNVKVGHTSVCQICADGMYKQTNGSCGVYPTSTIANCKNLKIDEAENKCYRCNDGYVASEDSKSCVQVKTSDLPKLRYCRRFLDDTNKNCECLPEAKQIKKDNSYCQMSSVDIDYKVPLEMKSSVYNSIDVKIPLVYSYETVRKNTNRSAYMASINLDMISKMKTLADDEKDTKCKVPADLLYTYLVNIRAIKENGLPGRDIVIMPTKVMKQTAYKSFNALKDPKDFDKFTKNTDNYSYQKKSIIQQKVWYEDKQNEKGETEKVKKVLVIKSQPFMHGKLELVKNRIPGACVKRFDNVSKEGICKGVNHKWNVAENQCVEETVESNKLDTNCAERSTTNSTKCSRCNHKFVLQDDEKECKRGRCIKAPEKPEDKIMYTCSKNVTKGKNYFKQKKFENNCTMYSYDIKIGTFYQVINKFLFF